MESQLDWCPQWNCEGSVTCAEVLSVDSGITLPGSEHWLCHWSPLCLCFLSWKMEILTVIKGLILMLKSGLCTGTRLNLRDSIFAEVETNSFITLLGKGSHSGLMVQNYVSHTVNFWGNYWWTLTFNRTLRSVVSQVRLGRSCWDTSLLTDNKKGSGCSGWAPQCWVQILGFSAHSVNTSVLNPLCAHRSSRH